MDLNHYEMADSYIAEHLPFARQWVKEHGWLCYDAWLREARNPKYGKVSWSNIAGAILYAYVEMRGDETHKPGEPYSYFDLLHDEAINKFVGRYMDIHGKAMEAKLGAPKRAKVIGEGVTMLKQCWHEYVFKKLGRHVYDVTPGLGEKLAHTKLSGLMTEDLRLPFQEIYVTIPARADLKVYNEDTGWHQAAGLYIFDDPGHGEALPESLLGTNEMTGWEMEELRITGKARRRYRCWRILVWGRSKSGEAHDDALFHFTVELPPGAHLEEAIGLEFAKIEREFDEAYEGPRERVGAGQVAERRDMFEYYRDHWFKVFQWAMNVVIYSTWPECDAEHVIADPEARKLWERMERLPKGKKKDDLKARFKAIPDPRRAIVLGRHVTVLDVAKERERHPGKPLEVRTLVSGHWQRYAIGKGRTERQWKWREPFWRGPAEAPPGPAEHRVV